MALQLSAALLQMLQIAWTGDSTTVSLFGWMRRNNTTSEMNLVSVGDSAQPLYFHSIQSFGAASSRAISFVPNNAYINGDGVAGIVDFYPFAATFTPTMMYLWVDGVQTSVAWTGTNVTTLNQLRIGNSVQDGSYNNFLDGAVEHIAVWRGGTGLTQAEVTGMSTGAIHPRKVQPSNLLHYLPLIDSLVDEIAGTWTAVNITTPTFEASGITYPNLNSRKIDHTNFDPSFRTNAEIANAIALKVLFQHASTGQDTVGDSDTDCSAGVDSQGTLDCGLTLVYDADNRYQCDRESFDTTDDYTWFATHTGLQDNHRGNPTPAIKVSMMSNLAANMCAAINVLFMKFCWIDVWPATDGYVADGAAFAATYLAACSAKEAANPGLIVPRMTMPLQSNEGYGQRDIFNTAVRTAWTTDNFWFWDFADIENYTTAGAQVADIGGFRAADSAYTIADGGHLNTLGKTREAMAYWATIAAIANEPEAPSGDATYRINETFTIDGNIDLYPVWEAGDPRDDIKAIGYTFPKGRRNPLVERTGWNTGLNNYLNRTILGLIDVTGYGQGSQPRQTGTGSGTVGGGTDVTGTGSGSQPRQTGTGSGTVSLPPTVTGTGSGQQPRQTGTGSGTVSPPVTGTGSGSQPRQTGTGSGTVEAPGAVTGTGSGSQPAQTGTGYGTVSLPPEVTGTGSGGQPRQTGTGSGTVSMPTVTGTGSGEQPRQTGTGSGTVEVPPEVTGTGSGEQPRQTGTGFGYIPVVQMIDFTRLTFSARVASIGFDSRSASMTAGSVSNQTDIQGAVAELSLSARIQAISISGEI